MRAQCGHMYTPANRRGMPHQQHLLPQWSQHAFSGGPAGPGSTSLTLFKFHGCPSSAKVARVDWRCLIQMTPLHMGCMCPWPLPTLPFGM